MENIIVEFSIGQEVFYVGVNEITKGKISGIYMSRGGDIMYSFGINYNTNLFEPHHAKWIRSKYIFGSKEDIIKTLERIK